MSLGQRVFVITASIHGSAGHRISHISSTVHSNMTNQEYMQIVNDISDVVDPVDRQSSFLETAKNWKDIDG